MRPWPPALVSYAGGKRFKTQRCDVFSQGRLIVFDGKEIIRFLFLFYELGRILLGVHGIGSNYRALYIHFRKHGLERWYLVAFFLGQILPGCCPKPILYKIKA